MIGHSNGKLAQIEKLLEKEPSFRLKQVKKAIFSDLIENWNEALNLPKYLRQKLSGVCPIGELTEEKRILSKDKKTVKILFSLKDGLKIESVLMKHDDGRRTVCVSSQAGCAMNCRFCATGHQKFERNLENWEIIEQVLFFARLLKKSREKATNVVFMGMGEPFLNYDNVLEAIKILNDKDGFNLGARHISISTCGIVGGIQKLARENLQINLAISFHAPTDELRSKLMPINKAYPIKNVLTAVDDYIKQKDRKVMFEYLMINEVNDSPVHAKELVKILKTLKNPLYFVNLITFNPVSHCKFEPSPAEKIKKFKEILERAGITTTERYRFGKEIKAACGQLTGV